MPDESDDDIPYGERLRRKGIQVQSRGRTWATKDEVREGVRGDGTKFKTVRDQNGHDVTDRTGPDGRERRDVRINLR